MHSESPGVFLLVTVLFGGAAAVATGRSVARSWAPLWHLAIYLLLLGMAVRFFHFALFQQPLLNPLDFVIDCLVIAAAATLGYRVTRASQMVRGYGWAFEAAGPFFWKRRSS